MSPLRSVPRYRLRLKQPTCRLADIFYLGIVARRLFVPVTKPVPSLHWRKLPGNLRNV